MYWIDGFLGLMQHSTANKQLPCLRGQDQVVLVRSAVLNVLKFGNHTFSPYPPSIQQKMFVPEEGINILSQSPMSWSTNFNSGEILSIKNNVCDVNPWLALRRDRKMILNHGYGILNTETQHKFLKFTIMIQ